MKKIKKVALALLYLLQILVIFRTVVAEIAQTGERAEPQSSGSRQEAVERNRDGPGWLALIRGDPRGLLTAAPATVITLATIVEDDKHGYEHPPETRDRHGILKREIRRRLTRGLILINLLPLLQRAARPAGTTGIAGDIHHLTRQRAVLS